MQRTVTKDSVTQSLKSCKNTANNIEQETRSWKADRTATEVTVTRNQNI